MTLMLRCAYVCVVSGLLLCGSSAFGQYGGMVGPENTITVTATGSADGDADWAEMGFTLQAHGPTAADAYLSSQDVIQKTTAQLEKLGFKKEELQFGLPNINGTDAYMGPMPPGEEQDPKALAERFQVSIDLTVQLNHFAPGTLFENVCRVMDATMGPAPGTARLASGREMMAREAIRFGVNDPKPLREKAFANALDRTAELAEVVARRAGKKVGPLSGITIEGQDDDGPMAMMRMMAYQAKPGRAVYRTAITATYRLQ